MPLPRSRPRPGRVTIQESTHRLPAGTVEAMRARQGNACLICLETLVDGRFVVEHDHRLARLHGHDEEHGCPRCIRSLACVRCNNLLGMAKDDPSILRRAALYLEAAGQ